MQIPAPEAPPARKGDTAATTKSSLDPNNIDKGHTADTGTTSDVASAANTLLPLAQPLPPRAMPPALPVRGVDVLR